LYVYITDGKNMEKTEFEHIAKNVRTAAMSAALSCGASTDDAEDIAQDITLKLWTLRTDINNTTHTVRLASRSARNLAIDKRKKMRVTSLDGKNITIEDSRPAPDTSLEEDEDTAWIEAKMKQLPPKEYEILRLRQIELKTNDEIAQMLGIEKMSVATILSRARTKLLNEITRRMKR